MVDATVPTGNEDVLLGGLDPNSIQNRLLLALPRNELEPLLPLLERVPLRRRQVLVEPHLPIRHAYFIESGTASNVSRTVSQHHAVEISIVGCLGVVGIPLVLGTNRSAFRCVVQLPGEALRMSAEDFERAIEASATLRALLFSHIQARMAQQAQVIVCNTRHTLRQRLARWLLMAHDRVDSRDILATHDLLSRMLGVRRAGITVALGEFKRAGILRAGRSRITLLDRGQLEAVSCECYTFIRGEYERLLRR
jgi:CRP-like cAMP-binding protein